MVGRVVRFFLGGKGKGLAQQRQTHQQEDQQRSPGKPTIATYADSMVARSYGFRLPEYSGPRGLRSQGRAVRDRRPAPKM